jgi:chromate transporter
VKTERVKEVFLVFLKLGFTAFGGPAAHIALMEEEIVKKRKWITHDHFLDLIGATNLIPGPNSTEMTMHCGNERAGIPGLFVAGLSFILPAAVITGIFAWLYLTYGKLPEVQPFLYGIKPAIIAIIINAMITLGKKALKNWQLGIIGVLVIISVLLGVNEIYALLGAGLMAIIFFSVQNFNKDRSIKIWNPLLLSPIASMVNYSVGNLFLIFLKIGSTLYGSGYVLVAYLQAELIDKTGWINQKQLLDAVAIGQFTPGPLFTTATFIGYQIGGVSGALAATAGIFLPSFFFVLIINPFIPKLRKSFVMRYFLDGVNIGAIALMVMVSIQLGMDVLVDWRAWVIGLAAIIVVLGFKKLNSTWIIAGGAVLGWLLTYF